MNPFSRKSASSAITLFLMASLIMISFGCAQKAGKAKEEPKEIKIGAILPLTGDAAEYGNDQRRGILLAMKQLRVINPNLGNRIQLVFEDSQGQSADAVNAIRKILLGHPAALLTTLSGASMAMKPMVEEKELLTLTVAAHPELTAGTKYIVRMLPTSAYYAKELAGFLCSQMDKPTVGVIYANDDFGHSLRDSFTKEHIARGGAISGAESFEKGETDFKSQITKLLGSKPSALFAVGYGKELGMVVRQARELGFSGKIYGTPEISYPDVYTVAGKSLNGTIYVSMWIDEESQRVKKFKQHYRQDYDRDPSLDSYLGYDEILMLVQAIETTERTRLSLRDAFFEMAGFEGLTGKLTVQSNGDVVFPLILKEIRNGQSKSLD